MKIRSKFVSNSSSSSFICGEEITLEQATETMKKLVEFAKTFDISFSEEDYEIYQASEGFGYGWEDYYGQYIRKAIEEKRIIIEDECDNAIPYYFYELISGLLKARRLHFG